MLSFENQKDDFHKVFTNKASIKNLKIDNGV